MKTIALCLAAASVLASASFAQQPVTEKTGEAQQRSLEGVTSKDFRYAVPLKVSEGVGKQPFLIKKKIFSASLRESMNYSDNIYVLKDYKRGDFSNVLDFDIGAATKLFKDWTLSAKAALRDFRYLRYGALDFNSASYSGTVNYTLKNWNFYTTLEHTDLYKRNYGDHFFQEDDGTIGTYYSQPVGKRALLYAGAQFTRQWTHPDASSKNLPTVYAGAILVPLENLPKMRLTLAGSYSYADYLNGDRQDNRYSIGPELSYEFYEWLTVGGSFGASWGDSNQSAYSYTALTSAAYLKLNYQF